jgi:conjugal transfer pilus assembly protein TraL
VIDASLDIPRRLNDPPRMFWWEIDVALILLGAVLAGMVAGFFMTGCALGVLLAWASARRSRASTPPSRCTCCTGTCRRMISGLKRTPPSHQRELARMKLDWLRADIASARRATTLLVLLLTGSLLVNVCWRLRRCACPAASGWCWCRPRSTRPSGSSPSASAPSTCSRWPIS